MYTLFMLLLAVCLSQVYYTLRIVLALVLLVVCLRIFLRVPEMSPPSENSAAQPSTQESGLKVKLMSLPIMSWINSTALSDKNMEKVNQLLGLEGHPKLLRPEKLKIALAFLQVCASLREHMYIQAENFCRCLAA
jgi:hypothetical protein